MNTTTPPQQGGLKQGPMAWLIWSLAVLFYFYEFMLQTSTGVMGADLMRSFNANGEQVGQLSAAYLYTYALMQIPAGMLMDRVNPKRLLVLSPALCALGCFVFVFASTLGTAILGRAIMGVGASFAVVGCFKVSALWFPANQFALLSGLMVAVGMLGAAGGQAPMAYITGVMGWRDTIFYGGLIGLVLSMIFACALRHVRLPEHANQSEQLPLRVFLKGFKPVLLSAQSWVASVYAGLMFVPTIGFAGLWGVPYLMQGYALSRPEAALWISLIYLGWAVGGPLFGAWSDRTLRRVPPMFAATVGTLVVMTFVWSLPSHPGAMAVALFFLGVFSSGFVLSFSIVKESHPAAVTGMAMGFINTMNSLSGAVSQPLLGKVLDHSWEGGYIDGARAYSLTAYQDALLAIPLCLLLALVLLPFIRETYCGFSAGKAVAARKRPAPTS